ncbi:L-2-hydroxyglutarate oxidase LhgO [Yarrowia sp. B02]|nr:L-2-hydroxyglutarate oxidase LhgO [Yarrowia sp. B02]
MISRHVARQVGAASARFAPALYKKNFSSTQCRSADFSHTVIGGGVVGLAVAANLAKKSPSNSVLLLERNPAVGMETSSRNSEVIHAGIYYPPESLRTELCIRGKELIYSEAQEAGVELNNCGKWIVAQSEDELSYLENMHARVSSLGVPIEWVSDADRKRLEPDVKATAGALNSPTTGIISAHSLMLYLEGEFENNGGTIALLSDVTGLEYKNQEYLLTVESEGDKSEITSAAIVNSAGLAAPKISNMLLPEDRHVTAYYAKGNYFSYSASKPHTNRLIYPCPSSQASLGTHLTLDLGGRIKFGPDLEPRSEGGVPGLCHS